MEYIGHTCQHASWSILVLQQEEYGRVSYINMMPVHLCNLVFSDHSDRVCSMETSWASKCAGESHWTTCPHCGDPLEDLYDSCIFSLLFCREVLCGVNNEWANLVDIASIQGLNILTVQPGSRKARLFCENVFQDIVSKNYCQLHATNYWTSVCKCLIAAQKSSQQVLESSNDQDRSCGWKC
jgi:hypothetical protein